MYIVIGATGYLGSYFINQLQKTEKKIIATYRSLKPKKTLSNVDYLYMDVTDDSSVDKLIREISSIEERINIIYLSAYHHPDKVEENKNLAWDINISSLAKFLNKLPKNCNLFYASTDVVCGLGTLENKYSENSKCTPINRYGEHKLLAEQITLTAGYNVLRFPFLIGPSATSKPHFYDFIKEHLEKNEELEMYEDSYRSSISFSDAAKYSIELIENHSSLSKEIIHVATDESPSKYDVAIKIAEKYTLSTDSIKKIAFSEKSNIFGVPRPQTVLLDNRKLKKLLNIKHIPFSL